MSHLEFWYDLASNYSCLSAMRIEALAKPAGVEVAWRPFLLGPIFKAQGWNSSPFNLYPAKGRYMLRDMDRICIDRGLPWKMPAQFPANSLAAVRVAHALEADGLTPAFTLATFEAEFGRGEDIADAGLIEEILRRLGLEPAAVIARANSDANKQGLKSRVAEAQARGIFGAPSFVTQDGELFWGDDRLEQALRWCQTVRV